MGLIIVFDVWDWFPHVTCVYQMWLQQECQCSICFSSGTWGQDRCEQVKTDWYHWQTAQAGTLPQARERLYWQQLRTETNEWFQKLLINWNFHAQWFPWFWEQPEDEKVSKEQQFVDGRGLDRIARLAKLIESQKIQTAIRSNSGMQRSIS